MEPTCSLYKHILYYLLPIISKALHIRNKHLRLNILFNFFKKSAFPASRAMGLGRSSENIETDAGTETFLG